MAKADGAHLKELARIEKQDAMILDDFCATLRCRKQGLTIGHHRRPS